jgi:Protein of unknown function (DUF2934)
MVDTRATARPEHEQHIRELAYHLWEQDGRPSGRDVEFWQRARALVAIEEKPRCRPAAQSDDAPHYGDRPAGGRGGGGDRSQLRRIP